MSKTTELDSARVLGRFLPISTKHSVEICSSIRGKPLATAKTFLERVTQLKQAVPFKRFVYSVPHRKGDMRTGRYPEKAAQHILNLLNSVEANAKAKGINNPVIVHSAANRGPATWRFGRQSRVKAKRTHVEIIVKAAKKEEPKTEKTAKPKAKRLQ